MRRETQTLEHRRFSDLGDYLKPGDLLVGNNSKVIPARIFANTLHGGEIEILLLEPTPNPTRWKCLVRPGRKVRNLLQVQLRDGSKATLERAGEDFLVEFHIRSDFFSFLETVGTIPLPPYFKRDAEDADREFYQTVFAKSEGSVAAPTAGLHFTPELIEQLRARGTGWEELTLHVGYATFAPLDLLATSLHQERYSVPPQTHDALLRVKANGGRVVPVGTTALRALESISLYGLHGNTDILIRPGHQFDLVGGLITNFHLPDTSLLLLVEALLGRPLLEASYQAALDLNYRFFSYGDAMLIL